MGCGTSRPDSARSWMIVDGWIPDKEDPTVRSPSPAGSGKVHILDAMKEKDRTGEESPFQLAEDRKLGDGLLGIADVPIIEQKLASLSPGVLFEDYDFPPDNSALFYSDRTEPDVDWLRPCELAREPKLLVDGISKDDIKQGILGDCWFLSSCAAIAQNPELMQKVIPEGQFLFGSDHRGLVHFRFWRFGKCVEVFVDDRLPTRERKLVYAHNSDPNEFWVALLEKAYAKLHGSYEAIEGGQAMDALVDLTGGLAERYELQNHTQELYQKLARAAAAGSFITCSRKGDWKASHNTVDEYGLIAGHAYTITHVQRIKRKQGAECLLRIRNPWGMGEEWKGAWCDRDHRWTLVDKETKDWLEYVEKEDGEFWMSYKDFTKHFQEVTICTVGPDFDGDGAVDQAGKILMTRGHWEEGKSAGGCRNDIYAFGTNPQFLLTVHEPDERDGSLLRSDSPKTTSSILIGLMQEHRRSQRSVGVKMLQISFLVYETEETESRLPLDHFMYNYETAKSGVYVNFREVCGRFELDPGNYVIVPTTYNKNEEGTFMLRVYAAKSISLQALPEFDPERDTGSVTPASTRSPSPDNPDNMIPPPVINAPSNHHLYSVVDPNGDELEPEIAALMGDEEDRKPSR